MQVGPCMNKDVLHKIWLSWVWDGLLGLYNKRIQWFLCRSYTMDEFSAFKTKEQTTSFIDQPTEARILLGGKREISGHFRDIFLFIEPTSLSAIVYHNSHHWSLDFWCCMTGQHQGLKNIGSNLELKLLCRNSWSSVFTRWGSKFLFQALVSLPVMKAEVNSMIGFTKLMCSFPSEPTLCRRQAHFFDRQASFI